MSSDAVIFEGFFRDVRDGNNVLSSRTVRTITSICRVIAVIVTTTRITIVITTSIITIVVTTSVTTRTATAPSTTIVTY